MDDDYNDGNSKNSNGNNVKESFDNNKNYNSKEKNILHTPSIEQKHVHEVYDNIADHWDHTRYAPWPRVADFVQTFPMHSLIGDVGCGNGKYIQKSYLGRPVSAGRLLFGSDRSINLLDICAKRSFDVIHCDNMTLPYRDGIFDGIISIAVFHHFSTVARRLQALKELTRIMKNGGRLLIYAWAQEQDGQSRRRFDGPDVLVKWHLRKMKNTNIKEVGKNVISGNSSRGSSSSSSSSSIERNNNNDNIKQVYDRYCHVFCESELESLVNQTDGLMVEKSYFDTSNWAVIAKKIKMV